MKERYFVLIFVIFNYLIPALAQEMDIQNFRKEHTDSFAIYNSRYDINGNICAVVHVSFEGIDELSFKGDIVGDIIKSGSKYTVYLPNRTKRLQLFNSGYIPQTIDFTNYEDSSKGLIGGNTYSVFVKSKMSIKKQHEKGSGILIFSSETPLRQLYVNGTEWKIIDNSAKRLLPYGEYEYEAIADGNIHKKGIVELKPAIGSTKVNIIFDNN